MEKEVEGITRIGYYFPKSRSLKGFLKIFGKIENCTIVKCFSEKRKGHIISLEKSIL